MWYALGAMSHHAKVTRSPLDHFEPALRSTLPGLTDSELREALQAIAHEAQCRANGYRDGRPDTDHGVGFTDALQGIGDTATRASHSRWVQSLASEAVDTLADDDPHENAREFASTSVSGHAMTTADAFRILWASENWEAADECGDHVGTVGQHMERAAFAALDADVSEALGIELQRDELHDAVRRGFAHAVYCSAYADACERAGGTGAHGRAGAGEDWADVVTADDVPESVLQWARKILPDRATIAESVKRWALACGLGFEPDTDDAERFGRLAGLAAIGTGVGPADDVRPTARYGAPQWLAGCPAEGFAIDDPEDPEGSVVFPG